MKLIKYMVATVLLISSAFASADHSPGHTVNLSFGLYTNDKPSTLMRQFNPVLRELEERMEVILNYNVTIDLKITKTYDDAIKLLADGTFDFARFGPVSYVRAKELNNDLQIAALESVGGEKVFYGIIAVQANSEILMPRELKGKRFAFGDKSSTIGRYLAQQWLMDNDILEGDLAGYEYLERHDTVGRAVAAGEYAAGALKENTFRQLVASGYQIAELDRFPNVTKPWITSAIMSDEVRSAMTQALLQIDNPKTLAKLKISGFLEGTDEDYDIIRQAIVQNFLFFRPQNSK